MTRLNGPQATGREYRNLSQPEHAIREEQNRRVPMRDGIALLADVLRPDASGRFPALVAASPYPRQIQNSGIPIGFVEAGTSSFFVPRGYAHVIANVRGTGGSGGEYAFFGANDRADMHDLVEWTAAQPWCDGHVGMVGISAFAMAPLAAAVEAPAHLKAIFPLAATSGASWLRPARALQEVSEGSSPRWENSRTSCHNLLIPALIAKLAPGRGARSCLSCLGSDQ